MSVDRSVYFVFVLVRSRVEASLSWEQYRPAQLSPNSEGNTLPSRRKLFAEIQIQIQNGVVTDADDMVLYSTSIAAMQELAFANIRREVRHRAPAAVTPFVASAGGGVI